ncbi:MAG: DUF4375 domain-containing protein [Planctomycetota bacterium]
MDQLDGLRKYADRLERQMGRIAGFHTVELPENVTPDQIRQWIAGLKAPKVDPETEDYIDLLGERIVPYLIEALRDPSFHTRKLGTGLFADCPLERVVECLERFAPPEAVPLIAPKVEHEDKDLRKAVAYVLGNIGTDECIIPLSKALRDPDEYVRDRAVRGIQSAIEHGRGSPAFRKAMFEGVAAMVVPGCSCNTEHAAECLMQLDRQRAISLLSNPDYFQTKNRELHHIIEALGKDAPTKRLLEIMEEVKPRAQADEYLEDYVYATGLVALAKQKYFGIEALCEDALTWKVERIVEAAADGLLTRADLMDYGYYLARLHKEKEWDSLTKPQQYAIAVGDLYHDVQNGGLHQYYYNSFGNQVRAALEGCKAMGVPEVAEIIHQSMAVFGKDGPSEDRGTRQEQLESLSERQVEELDRLSKLFYEKDVQLYVEGARYVIKNRAHFTDKSDPQ